MQKCSVNLLKVWHVGQTFIIKEVSSSLEKYRPRLLELGFFSGAKIKLLQKSLQEQTFLVEVGGIKFCLQKQILEKILLEAE